jgi:hypothetical protein
MNKRLEQFVRDHREEFDAEEPAPKVWESIREDMGFGDQREKKQASVVRLQRARWTIAAAVLILIAGATWALIARRNNDGPAIAGRTTTSPAANSSTQSGAPTQTPPSQADGDHNLAGTNPVNKDDEHSGTEMDASINEEMYHYAKLVEIKHRELKSIEKDEPLLYRQFSLDVSRLDSVYQSLQVQLPKNPNREQLLEAMLQNLQLQMGLLNHQLDIIKQINHSKKTAYEKAYKTA